MTFVDTQGLDVSDEEYQKAINAFNVAMQDCPDCTKSWHKEQSVQSWYPDFQQWTQLLPSRCSVYQRTGDAIDTVPQEYFFPCL